MTHPGCRSLHGLDGMFAALTYTKAVRKLIASFKYKPFVSDLKHLLGALFIEGILEEESFIIRIDKNTIFVPIPLHSQKLRERGYNHAGLLSIELSKYFHLPKKDLLIRQKKTKSQFGLTRDKRRENLKGAFALKVRPGAKTVVLVDDIVTTGTTFQEASKVLKRNGTEHVYGVALAHGN